MSTLPPSDATPPPCARPALLSEPLGPSLDPLGPRRARQLVWALIALGIAARGVRYLLRFPLWQDEAYLAVSFLDRGYAELMGPLEVRQVAPLGFLWVQHSILQVLGFTEYTLRLFPLLCGVGSLLVFGHLAGRLLRGTALVLAVGFLAVAYPAIRYSVEAKPYSCDMFVSLGLLALAVEWWRRPHQTRWLWALAAVVPLAVGLSYPAVFTAGGISVAVAVLLWRLRLGRGWPAWVGYNILLVAGFAALFALSASSQSANSREFMAGVWENTFPPLTSPLALVGWLFAIHTGDMLAYPIGGARGASTLTLICCVVALVVLVRRRRGGLVLLLLAPLAVNFVAASVHRYPYGGPVRFSFYFAPVVCTLGGLGAAVMLIGTGAGPRQARAQVAALVLLLSALGFGSIGRDLCKPYKNRDVRAYRDLARTLWHDRAGHGEVVCVRTDLGRHFAPRHSEAALVLYRCNKRIYSARATRREMPAAGRVSAERPLYCVHYRSVGYPLDRARLQRWLDQVQSRYELAGQEEHRLSICYDRRPLVEHVDVYRLVPKSQAPAQVGRATSGATMRR